MSASGEVSVPVEWQKARTLLWLYGEGCGKIPDGPYGFGSDYAFRIWWLDEDWVWQLYELFTEGRYCINTNKISGVVLKGTIVGEGVATCKKPAFSCPILLWRGDVAW